MSVIYGIIAGLSLLLLIGYCVFVQKKEIWLLLLFVSVFFVNSGYFTLSISKTLGEALLANRLAYLGSVFLPLFMLMTIIEVCKYPYKRWVLGILICINISVFLIAASPGYTDWYYKDVTLIFINGVAKLQKVYGPLHKVYYIFLFSYLAMMTGIILHSSKSKLIASPQQALLLLVVVLLNILFWLIEQLVHIDFEFLSISYIVSELLLLCLYSMLQDLEKEKENLNVISDSCSLVNKSSDFIKSAEYWSETAKLSNREKEIFLALLDNKKRKDIAEDLHISENTVKTHTSNIFSKLEVSNRSELIEKVMQNI